MPKGEKVEVTPIIDGTWKVDNTFYVGSCESNTARAHQIEAGNWGGCGISTTRSEERAIYFATTGYLEDGYVYVIDESKLEKVYVSKHEFENPLYLHEYEVTLIERSGSYLPEQLILEKYLVRRDGKRI